MDIKTAYQILALPPSASVDELRARYRLLARRCHPDTSPTGDARQFLLLSTAYQLVLDKLTQAAAPSHGSPIDADVIAASEIRDKITERFRILRHEYNA